MNDKSQPCQKRLDADCFRNNPAWAKQALAYRLVHLLTPKQLTRRLPKGLRLALIAPGVIIPPGLVLPDGTLVGPGTDLPGTWSLGDPVPPGIVIVPGTTFPPGWTPEDPPPDGVTLDPGAEFPPGWNPPDPVPEGLYPTPVLPPAAVATGPTPPTYLDPGTPGPVHRPGGGPPAVCPPAAFIENFTSVTPHRISADRVHTAFTADVGTWYCYLDRGISGTNHLQVIAGRVALYQSTQVNYQYVYIGDSDVFNIRCATQIRAQNKRKTSGGETALRLYNGRPPDGTIILSEPMRTSGSYGFTYLDLSAGISQYTDLYLCLYVGGGHWQEVTRVDMQ